MLEQYIQDYKKCTDDNSRKELLAHYNTLLDTLSSEERTKMLLEIAENVAKLSEKILPQMPKDTVISVKDYCEKRKVSRQYVYQEIKKGKFKTIDLPVFVEYLGKKIKVGEQKFLAF